MTKGSKFRPWLGLDHRSTVVDLGAGTGPFATAVSGSCRRVVAVDVSPAMLRTLRRNVAAAAADNIKVVHAGFLTYEHVGAPADFVYSRFALHHLPDFWKALALARMRKMLRPTGLLRLWDVVYVGPDEAEERVEAWCATTASARRPVGAAGSWRSTSETSRRRSPGSSNR